MYKVTMNEMQKKKWNSKIQNNEKWTDNNIGDEGAAKISESLMINTTLTELYLGSDDHIIKNNKEWYIN